MEHIVPKSTVNFRTKDHPQANGRVAQRGEQQWTFTFFLEDGSTLKIVGGKESRDAFRAMFDQEEIDDLSESNPTGN